jgi:uncharacterized protein YecE (DUF72 family)
MTAPAMFGAFFSGMSGIVLPTPKYKFPVEFQDSSRLTYYSSLFNSIEINRSFYGLPKAKTLNRWSNEVPANFKFTFKLWKQISHSKALQFNDVDVGEFMHTISNVGDKRGCLLIQFPASLKNHQADHLEHLLSVIEMNSLENPWKVAIEFRDNSWYTEDTYNLMNQYGATIVVHDKPGAPPAVVDLKSKIKYIRFHGPRGDYRGSYDEAFLHEYATYIHEWREAGNSVFVYFNNTNGEAYNNLRQLLREVDEKS